MLWTGFVLVTALLQLLGAYASSGQFQIQFDHLVGTANRLHAETQVAAASVAVLRGALLLCANCTVTKSKGHFAEKIFVFDEFADRKYLSDSIFPALSLYQPKQLLWVGVQAYTLRATYQLEQQGVEVTTIEPDTTQSVYGSSRRHIEAPLQNLLKHVPPGSFDAVIINGVIGWGIDGEQAVTEAVKIMFAALRDGGSLVVGWNKGMGTCCNFEPYFLPHGLSGLPAVYEVPNSDTHHVFESFRKNEPTTSLPKLSWENT